MLKWILLPKNISRLETKIIGNPYNNKYYKMSTAILYIRVSTDEQALTGYSMRSQEERLVKFCLTGNIRILQTILEDHSAKNFHRPAWHILMRNIVQNKSLRPNLLLFTRWDRFSRNTTDAYYMINKLRKLGIETQAVDQPLDMSIPENKVLLAMYIVTAEVENERRSLNVKHGIYKAKQEGRWIGKAPMGYINALSESHRKIIIPHEPLATIIKGVFENIEENISMRLLYKEGIERGLHCSLNGFWNMLHNPVYCGRIRVPTMNGIPSYEVKGGHVALITEELFDSVQLKLKLRKKVQRRVKESSILILRGFMYCPNCSKRLSGSGSKGRNKKYYYYHCKCGYRVRADKVNNLFAAGLNNLTASGDYIKIYKEIIKNTLLGLFHPNSLERGHLTKVLETIMNRVIKARELLLKGEIDNDDYLIIKSNCENQIKAISVELNRSYSLAGKLKKRIRKTVIHFSNPGSLYENADVSTKRKLVTLFIKENMVFDENCFGNNLNNTIRIIYDVPLGLDSLLQGREEDNSLLTIKLTDEEIKIYQKITNIEENKEKVIPKALLLKNLQFLFESAKIFIAK